VTARPHLLASTALAAGLLLSSLPAGAERPLPEWPAWEAKRLIDLGEAAIVRQEFAAALSLAERAVKLQPNEAQTWSFLSRSSLRGEDWPRARDASDQWLALAPKDPLALFFAAQSRVLSNQLEDATTLFHRLAAQSPEDPSGPLGLALCAGRQGDWDTMEEQLLQARRRVPDLSLAGLPLEPSWAFLADSQAGLEVLDRVLSSPSGRVSGGQGAPR